MLEYTTLLLCSRCLSLSAKERRAIAFLLRRCVMHKVAVMGKWRKFGAILMGLFCNRIYLKAGCVKPRIRAEVLASIYFRSHIKKSPQNNNNMIKKMFENVQLKSKFTPIEWSPRTKWAPWTDYFGKSILTIVGQSQSHRKCHICWPNQQGLKKY